MRHPEQSLPLARVRTLLRRLRDLNLAARIAVRPGCSVSLAGCTSIDAPVEQGVRYRLLDPSGGEATLGLRPGPSGIQVWLRDASGERVLEVPCVQDDLGRTALPRLAARVPDGATDPRAYARVLRRVVRQLYAA